MPADPLLDFYNQSNRTEHPDWNFDMTGYLQRSAGDIYYSMQKAIRESETEDHQH